MIHPQTRKLLCDSLTVVAQPMYELNVLFSDCLHQHCASCTGVAVRSTHFNQAYTPSPNPPTPAPETSSALVQKTISPSFVRIFSAFILLSRELKLNTHGAKTKRRPPPAKSDEPIGAK